MCNCHATSCLVYFPVSWGSIQCFLR
uniref:Uncharacterized protein n=1 Tax=Arundo donax TaxID=35708 RepID=A0A0A8YZS4_ARUDO